MLKVTFQRFATQDVRMTGPYEGMHRDGFPAFLWGKRKAIFHIWGDIEDVRLCGSFVNVRLQKIGVKGVGKRLIWAP